MFVYARTRERIKRVSADVLASEDSLIAKEGANNEQSDLKRTASPENLSFELCLFPINPLLDVGWFVGCKRIE